MHEMSVALEVCRIAEERLGREALPSLRAVGLEVGDDAGIELSSLSFCLETLLGVPPFAGATPLIDRTAIFLARPDHIPHQKRQKTPVPETPLPGPHLFDIRSAPQPKR